MDILSSLIGSAVQGLGGVITSVINSNAQKKINQQNIGFAREANAYNRENMYIANELQRSMFDYTNSYNDPSAAKARLLRAGFNPYVNGESIATQQAADMPSAPQGDSAVTPNLTAPKFDYVSNSFDSFAHGLLAMSQSRRESVGTDFELATFGDRVRKAFEDAQTAEQGTFAAKIKNHIAGMEANLLESTYDDRIQQFKADLLYRQEAVRELMAKQARDNAEALWLSIQPQLKSQELGIKQEEVSNILKSAIMSYNVGMAQVSAERFATGVHGALEQKRINIERGRAINDALNSLRHLNLNKEQLKVATGQLDLANRQLEWDQSWKKVGHDFVKGFGAGAGAAAGAYVTRGKSARSVQAAKTAEKPFVKEVRHYKDKNGNTRTIYVRQRGKNYTNPK